MENTESVGAALGEPLEPRQAAAAGIAAAPVLLIGELRSLWPKVST